MKSSRSRALILVALANLWSVDGCTFSPGPTPGILTGGPLPSSGTALNPGTGPVSPSTTPTASTSLAGPQLAGLLPATTTTTGGGVGSGQISGMKVCVDPGHPSETSDGTRGPSGVTENHINWVIGKKLEAELLRRGAQVKMTKNSENERVTNQRRAEISNEFGAAVMLRLHCDDGSSSGFCLYAPDRQGTVNGVTGPSQDVIQSSQAAAQKIFNGMNRVLTGQLAGLGVKGDSATAVGSKQGALTGSIFSKVPAVTVEMCFLNQAKDEAFINSEQGQNLMVQALVAGLSGQ